MRCWLCAACPPMCSTGLSDRNAVAMPVTALVQPGPAVVTTHPSRSGLARVSVGGVCRHLLVAHVHHLYALVDAPVVDVDDVATAEREDGVDALVPERLRHEMPAGHYALLPALLRQGVFRSPRPRGGLSFTYCHVETPRSMRPDHGRGRRLIQGFNPANRRIPLRVWPGSGCAHAPDARRARRLVLPALR